MPCYRQAGRVDTSGIIMQLFKQLRPRKPAAKPLPYYDSIFAYERLIASHLEQHPRDLAFALAVGSLTVDLFQQQGDGHVQVLKAHGLADGMAIFDLGCGCGRTAQALQRSGWRGRSSSTSSPVSS